MRPVTAILSAALALSALLNVVLLARRAPAPADVERSPAPPRPGAGDAAELDRERALARELREKVKRLEADREVLARAATDPAAPAAKPAGASLREKLRRMKKLVKDAEAGLNPDPDAVLELSAELMEIMRLGATRGKDPKAYADFLQACAEVALEDAAALTPEQAGRLAAELREMADALGRVSAASAGERLIQELEIENAAMKRVDALLTPPQREALKKSAMENIPTMSSSMSMSYLTQGKETDTIVKAWTQSYKLDEAQLPGARAAAESFLASLRTLERTPDDAPDYEARIAALRAQMGALRTLEGALTAEQLERLRTQSPREFVLFDVPQD